MEEEVRGLEREVSFSSRLDKGITAASQAVEGASVTAEEGVATTRRSNVLSAFPGSFLPPIQRTLTPHISHIPYHDCVYPCCGL